MARVFAQKSSKSGSLVRAGRYSCKAFSFSDMYSTSSAALLVEPDNGDIQFWHIRAMIALGGYEIAQKHFSQHSQSLSDEQKKLLAGLFAEIH